MLPWPFTPPNPPSRTHALGLWYTQTACHSRKSSLPLHCSSHPKAKFPLSIASLTVYFRNLYTPTSHQAQASYCCFSSGPVLPVLGDCSVQVTWFSASLLPPKAFTPSLLELCSQSININQTMSFPCSKPFTCSSLLVRNVKVINDRVHCAP